MFPSPGFVVLGSRSPRRLALLAQLVPAAKIEVLPPRSADEADFDGLHEWTAIEDRLLEIARSKFDDVVSQVRARKSGVPSVVITADTVVVVSDKSGQLKVLGQPPGDSTWRAVVARWFREFYAGRPHAVATAVCLGAPQGQPLCGIEKTQVTMRADVDPWLDWYLDTGEPLGKAGGYAVQGAADVFITRVDGSISNVVGLPLARLIGLWAQLPSR